jgi:hypothetical protein
VKRLLLPGVGVVLAAGALSMLPMRTAPPSETLIGDRKIEVAFSDLSADPPRKPLSLVFLHHSVGGRWLADAGAKRAIGNEIWTSHPEGGGLRAALEKNNYQVHEASYGSALGDKTDRGDFLPKFRDHLDELLATELNDKKIATGRNQIVLWKECFPNNFIDDDKALAQAQQQMRDLLPVFAAHPDVLFVHVTTPPLAPIVEKEPAWKYLARFLLGKPQPGPRLQKSGPLARKLNDWVAGEWLKDYPHKNVAVFDLYNLLTDGGKSNFLAYPTGDGSDSHPSRAGNQRATAELVPFLNRAVRRAGLSE